MKCSVPVRLVVLMTTLRVAWSMPQDSSSSSFSSTPRSAPPIGETIRQLTKQLMANSSDVVFDTRTPPKVKQHLKRKQEVENSHAGVAIPVDEETVLLEESTKKLNFYKIEKPTTNSGLSTWILLSGQTTRKPNNDTKLAIDMPNRVVKPIFKKRTTLKQSTTTAGPTTKLTKIKASLLNNAMNKDNDAAAAKKPSTMTTIGVVTKMTTKSKPTTLSKATTISKPTTISKATTTMSKPLTSSKPTSISKAASMTKLSTLSKATTMSKLSTKSMSSTKSTTPSTLMTTVDKSNATDLDLETKEGDVELSTNSTNSKKTRRPNNKRKKNKNRRKRPNVDKSDNSTKNANKIANKEKPISTQIYNYLSREVMPTVGVGLVGLMVTAGLASYFLYPFGITRRSYEIDRKDKENSYYYNDYYSPGGGVAEEELIGKVIAGMPHSSSSQSTSYKPYRQQQYTTRPPYPNTKYRQIDQQHYSTPGLHPNHKMNPQGSVETVQLTSAVNYKSEDNIYVPQKNYQFDYYNNDNDKTVDDPTQKFVVGSYIQEPLQEVTPVTVPEHGPRVLNYRKKRSIDDHENEIDYPTKQSTSINEFFTTTMTMITTAKPIVTTTAKVNETDVAHQHFNSFVELIGDLFRLKINLGLQVLQNATRSVSTYLSNVQRRFDQHYRNQTHH